MAFKKRKDFKTLLRKRKTALSLNEEKVNRLIKTYFLVSLFVFFVSLFKRMKDSALVVKFYKTAVRLLEKSVMETIISNNIIISSCLANGQVEIHLEGNN